MRLSRAILLSILITLAVTLILQLMFGAMAFGLFLLLPLSFAFSHKRHRSLNQPHDPNKPIQPK